MSRLYCVLHSDAEVELGLLVSGAHLSPAYGSTVDNIRQDGLPIVAEIETLISGDTFSSRLKTASGLLAASIDIVRRFQPDVILLAGDREDVLVGGMLGSFLGIPTAHFFSGDHGMDGHIDNPIRHATSKLVSTHFVSIPEHRERLLKLGESSRRIFVIGSVALDKFVDEPAIALGAILDKISANAHARSHPLALLIFHPVAQEKEREASYIGNATRVLIESGYHVCIGSPNTDPGNFGVVRVCEELAARQEVTFYRNLSRGLFVNLLRHSRMICGNSSAGLLEAASVRIAAINIGLRQRGRLCGDNVIFTDGSLQELHAAVVRAQSPSFQEMLGSLRNPYGDGQSSRKAAHLLKTIDFQAFLRKPEDPLDEESRQD